MHNENIQMIQLINLYRCDEGESLDSPDILIIVYFSKRLERRLNACRMLQFFNIKIPCIFGTEQVLDDHSIVCMIRNIKRF